MTEPIQSSRAPASLASLANGLLLGALALAGGLASFAPDAYYRASQEDEVLEWTTFWLFAGAALGFARQAWGSRAGGLRALWLPAGMALFCLGVAGEEISWGQRLLGYRPPVYFLEHNYQQELNVHNVASKWLRMTVLLGVTLGYGVALPLVARMPRAALRLDHAGLRPPPLWLVPSFLAMGVTHVAYPWSFTGEWVEHMLGGALLFVALSQIDASSARLTLRFAAAWGIAILLGVITARAWWGLRDGLPETLQAAQVELDALARDVASARTRTRCGLHKRIYAFVQTYEQEKLREGAFVALQGGGLSEDRATFFLDPWNSPYWVRHICSDDRRRRAIYVYSFGPNRMRDSLPWEVLPDDLGAWVSRPDEAPESR